MNHESFEVLFARLRALGNKFSGASAVLRPAGPVALGLYWALLLLAALAFGGHNSKFVYVDF